jgi:hypothetical protein
LLNASTEGFLSDGVLFLLFCGFNLFAHFLHAGGRLVYFMAILVSANFPPQQRWLEEIGPAASAC